MTDVQTTGRPTRTWHALNQSIRVANYGRTFPEGALWMKAQVFQASEVTLV